MPITVKIPTGKEKSEYSLFVNGKIVSMVSDKQLGTLLEVEGCGVAFYSASNSRRAIIFQENSEDDFGIPLEEGNIPYFKQRVRVIYKAKGRKVDMLKFMCHNLERKYDKEMYGFGIKYWLLLASYIDSYVPHRNKKNGNKRQIYLITEKYKKRKNEL